MKINPIKFNNLNYKLNPPSANFKTLAIKNDVVSFKGAYLENQDNINARKAVNLGAKVYAAGANFYNASKLIKEKIPELSVYTTDKIPVEITGGHAYDAFFCGYTDDKMNNTNLTMYIPSQPKGNSKLYKLMYASDVAHEYTHALQTVSNKDNAFLLNLTNNDIKYARALPVLCEGGIFELFDVNIKNQISLKNLEDIDKINARRFGIIVPRETYVSKYQMLKNFGLNGEKDFQEEVEKAFKICFDSLMKKVMEQPENMDNEISDEIERKLKSDYGIDKIEKDFMKFCAYLSNKEAEAYTVESELIRKALRTKNNLNIDIFPLYYEMLEKAFS